MNWDAVGAIGEIVGAVAVIATLVYLSIQTTRTRIALESEGTLSTAELFSRWRTAFAQSPDLAQIFAKANRGETLNEDEQLKFSLFCDEIFFSMTVSYETTIRSGAVHESAAEIDYVMNLFALVPSMEVEWKRTHSQLEGTSPSLVAAVDQRLQSKGT